MANKIEPFSVQVNYIVCYVFFDYQCKMIIFVSLLTTFEQASSFMSAGTSAKNKLKP